MKSQETPESIDNLCVVLGLPKPGPCTQEWVAELPESYRTPSWIERYISVLATGSLDIRTQQILLDLCLDSINDAMIADAAEAVSLWGRLIAEVRLSDGMEGILDYWARWENDEEDSFSITPYVRMLISPGGEEPGGEEPDGESESTKR